METITRSGDRLDTIAQKYLGDAGLWERIAERNKNLPLSYWLPDGIRIIIPEREIEVYPDILPWNSELVSPTIPSEPLPLPPTPQPGAGGADEFLTGGGWLPPAAAKALLGILEQIQIPVGVAEGGTGQTTPNAALNALGGLASALLDAVNGVAPLDADRRVPVRNLPASIPEGNLPAFQAPLSFPIPLGEGGTGISVANIDALRIAIGAVAVGDAISPTAIGIVVAPLSGGIVPLQYLPSFQAPLALPLALNQGGTGIAAANTDALRMAIGAIASSSVGIANGIAPLDAQLKLPVVNLPTIPIGSLPLNSAFPFTNGASFRGGSSPTATSDVVQLGVDVNGLPRYWLVNAEAPANSRIKSITVANNGNIQIRHHNDDLSEGNVLEHSASGNVLTNGGLRCGGGSVNFTGASFVPGALYYRSDLSMLTYSDGTNWRRMDTNAIV